MHYSKAPITEAIIDVRVKLPDGRVASRLELNEVEGDELSYVSVPMERAFSVKVKYRYVGEMKPLVYPLED
jgi:hypothetical protein